MEHVDNACILTIAANPKEYLEIFEGKSSNKKHKGIRKGSPGLRFENFAQRIWANAKKKKKNKKRSQKVSSPK